MEQMRTCFVCNATLSFYNYNDETYVTKAKKEKYRKYCIFLQTTVNILFKDNCMDTFYSVISKRCHM